MRVSLSGTFLCECLSLHESEGEHHCARAGLSVSDPPCCFGHHVLFGALQCCSTMVSVALWCSLISSARARKRPVALAGVRTATLSHKSRPMARETNGALFKSVRASSNDHNTT